MEPAGVAGKERLDPLTGQASVIDTETTGLNVRTDRIISFGHVRLERINPGEWFAKQFSSMLNAQKVLVQKSGYYSRSAAANEYDLALIKQMTDLAVDSALVGTSGVIGNDEENGDALSVIAFDRRQGRIVPSVERTILVCAHVDLDEALAARERGGHHD